MASIFEREKGMRWARGQRFRLSSLGVEAEARYQTALTKSREQGGRAAFDEATSAWAATLGVQPGDGLYLCELRASVRTLLELVQSLETCGVTKSEAKAALERLIHSKLAEPEGT